MNPSKKKIFQEISGNCIISGIILVGKMDYTGQDRTSEVGTGVAALVLDFLSVREGCYTKDVTTSREEQKAIYY